MESLLVFQIIIFKQQNFETKQKLTFSIRDNGKLLIRLWLYFVCCTLCVCMCVKIFEGEKRKIEKTKKKKRFKLTLDAMVFAVCWKLDMLLKDEEKKGVEWK